MRRLRSVSLARRPCAYSSRTATRRPSPDTTRWSWTRRPRRCGRTPSRRSRSARPLSRGRSRCTGTASSSREAHARRRAVGAVSAIRNRPSSAASATIPPCASRSLHPGRRIEERAVGTNPVAVRMSSTDVRLRVVCGARKSEWLDDPIAILLGERLTARALGNATRDHVADVGVVVARPGRGAAARPRRTGSSTRRG